MEQTGSFTFPLPSIFNEIGQPVYPGRGITSKSAASVHDLMILEKILLQPLDFVKTNTSLYSTEQVSLPMFPGVNLDQQYSEALSAIE